MTQSIAAKYHLRFQVCKSPEKKVSPEDDDDYPVPQVRAARAPLEPTRFSDARLKPNLKQARKPSSENNDTAGALPQVASSSTVLAPIGAKTNYIGPTSPTAKRTTQFRVPFKVPFNTVSEHPRVTSMDNEQMRDEAKPLRDSENAAEEAVIDLTDQGDGEALPSSPFRLQDNEIDLDVTFSQKIPTKDRNSTYRDILRALRKVFMHNPTYDDRWNELLESQLSDEETRSAVLSTVSKELEFSVHSMSASQAGYVTRSSSVVNSIQRLAREEAWTLEHGADKAHEDDWDVIGILRRACMKVKERKAGG